MIGRWGEAMVVNAEFGSLQANFSNLQISSKSKDHPARLSGRQTYLYVIHTKQASALQN